MLWLLFSKPSPAVSATITSTTITSTTIASPVASAGASSFTASNAAPNATTLTAASAVANQHVHIGTSNKRAYADVDRLYTMAGGNLQRLRLQLGQHLDRQTGVDYQCRHLCVG